MKISMQIESIIVLKPRLEYLLKTNSNRSLSSIFKTLRKDERISHIADYPLISYILVYGASRDKTYHWRCSQLRRAMRYSKELKGKHIPEEWKKYLIK